MAAFAHAPPREQRARGHGAWRRDAGQRRLRHHKLALYQVDGEFYATDNTCTHGAASLSEDGCVVGDRVECSWHNGQYDIRSGQACAMPCTEALKVWPVQIVDGQVCVEITVAG